MKLLQLTLDDPAANIALDEALLETAEQTASAPDVLRLWEAPRPLVVVGRSSRLEREVDREACERERIPIIRRCSGGASIIAGPGCLMYAVVLSYERRPELRSINNAHRFVLDMLARGLTPAFPTVEAQGISDLTSENRKISGNSLRCKRTHLLYHGTLLYDFPLEEIGRLLKLAPRQPEYRAGRDHLDFVANLPSSRSELEQSLIRGFDAHDPLHDWPRDLTERLVEERYRRDDWNFRL